MVKIALGEWSEDRHGAQQKELTETIRAAGKEAEAVGTLSTGSKPSVREMFEEVYKEMPWNIREQRQEAGV